MKLITPQKGKQTEFLQSSADIVFYGGAAGGGKTYGLLLEPIRHIMKKGFGAVIFRKNLTQIDKEGALWDTAETIYTEIGGRGVKGHVLTFFWDRFKTKVSFAYLAKDSDVYKWQGTQITLMGFDELTHFSKRQFFYMLSRNRSVCGVRPYVRGTTNPDPDSWVREFIDWWIDENGYVIEARSGVIRWFIHQNDEIFWFDSEEDAKKTFPKRQAKSFTFISSNVHDNQILMTEDPQYIANLEALPAVEQERLLKGNWNVKAGAGDYFKRSDFEVRDAAPKMVQIVRCWDFAATVPSETNPDPDWTVGMKAGICEDGKIWILDVCRKRLNPAGVKQLLKNTTTQDGKDVVVGIPQDAGSAGKHLAQEFIKMLIGYSVESAPVTGSKEIRATPASSQAGIGNIILIRGDWNEAFLKETEGFPLAKHDDIVDALSDCIEKLTQERFTMQVIARPSILR